MFVARGNTVILWPEVSDGGYTSFYICMKAESSYTLYTKADSVLFSNHINPSNLLNITVAETWPLITSTE